MEAPACITAPPRISAPLSRCYKAEVKHPYSLRLVFQAASADLAGALMPHISGLSSSPQLKTRPIDWCPAGAAAGNQGCLCRLGQALSGRVPWCRAGAADDPGLQWGHHVPVVRPAHHTPTERAGQPADSTRHGRCVGGSGGWWQGVPAASGVGGCWRGCITAKSVLTSLDVVHEAFL